MTLTPKDHPKYWVTWLAKAMAGENMCLWALWLKGHYHYEKQDSTGFDIQNWIMQHTALLRSRADEMRSAGYKVTLEDENPVSVVGKTGVEIAGKMDLVAVKGRKAIIEDAKTGRRRTSDHAQVGIYMLLYPDKTKDVWGNVIYTDGIEKVNPIDKLALGKLIASVSEEPAHTPSARECRYCDIKECTKRHVVKKSTFTTDLF